MKKLQYFLLLALFALPIQSFAQPFVQFTAQSTSVDCTTSSLSIDIDVTDFIQMNAFDYSFHWDPTVLTLTSIDDPGAIPSITIGQSGSASGTLTFSWFSILASGNTIPDGTIITLNFDLIGNASQTSVFTFDNTPTFINIAQYGMALNSSQYILNVGLLTITDNSDPTITCPTGPLTFDTGGATTTQITGAAPTANDNCGIDFISYNLSGATTGSGTGIGDVSNNVNFEIGTTTVTYTATDFGGNTATCSFDVEVTNNTASTILTISMDNNLQVNCEDNTVNFNIYADNFTDMRGAQFTINWPSASLQYVDTANYALSNGSTAFGISNVSSGELVFSWNDAVTTSLPNGTILFTLQFIVNSNAGVTLPISILTNSEEFTNSTSFPFPMNPSEYDIFNGSIYIFDNANPTITCPSNLTVNSTNGTNAVVNGITPTTADNCGIMDTTYTLTDVATSNNIGNGTGDASGTTFPVGTTNVAYTITDFDGNQATCDFDVTVQTSGVITVTVDSIQVNCETGTVLIGMPVENFIDVIGVQFTLEWDPTELQFVSIFEDNFTPNGIPGLGQVATGQLNFSWFDISNPTTFADGDSILVFEFNILDQTPGNDYDINFINTPVPFEVSTATATPDPTAISEPGNVEIIDNSSPVISCPTDITVNSSNGTNATVNGIAPASVSDNCGIMDTTYTLTDVATSNNLGSGTGDASGTSFPIGTTNVEYTVTDEGGNQATCDFDVTVQNSGVITVTVDSIEVNCETGTVLIGMPVENFVDVIGVQFTLEWDPTELQFVSIVEDNFTPNGTPGLGQVAMGQLNFSWFDISNPTTFADGDSILVFEFNILDQTPGNDYDINFINIPVPFEVSTATAIPDPTAISEPGNVEIVDNSSPVISCPTDITVNSSNGTNATVNGIAPASVSDNCGIIDTTYILTDVATSNNIGSGTGDASGTSFPIGTTNVEYTVTDEGGNQATCNFNVTVQNTGVITVSVDSIQVNCETGTVLIGMPVENFVDVIGVQFTLDWDPNELQFVSIVEDNFTPDGTPGLGQVALGRLNFSWFDISNPTTFADGDSILVFEFNILNQTPGNDYDINFVNIPVPFEVSTATAMPDPTAISEPGNIEIIDNSDPVISCPADVTANSTNGTDAIVNGIAPTASDNCGIIDTTYILTDVATSNNIGSGTGDASGTTFPVGTTNVEYTVTDEGGNQATCNFNVTVQNTGVITVSVDSIQVNCETGNVFIGVPVENFVDVIGVQFTLEWDPTELEFVTVAEDNFTPDGITGLGQVASGQFNFSWFDSNNPVTFADGDSIIVLEFDVLDQTVGNDYDINFINIPVPFSVITQTSFPFNDPSAISEPGNIEIVDNIGPVITCPADVTVNSANGTDAIVNGIAPTITDNCGIMDTTYTLTDIATSMNIGSGTGDASGTTFPVGTTMVTYTATDNGGNSVNCNFNVTVLQDPLMVECPMAVNQSADANVCSATLDLPVTILSDPNNVNTISWDITGNSGPVSGTGNISNFTFSIGTSTVTYTVTDNFGASETCSFDVTITDQEGPIISGTPADTTVECDNIPAVATLTAMDQCDGITNVTLINESVAPGPIPGSSIITRTWGTIDAAGNISTVDQIITVIDTTAPTITCPADITTNSTFSPICGANVFWTIPSASDNCDPNVQVTSSFAPNDFFPLGTTTVTYTATDSSGNVAICSFDVTVVDTEAPVLTGCPLDITVSSGTNCSTSVIYNMPTAVDNCDPNPMLSCNIPSGNTFSVGTTPIICTATDASGNTSTCSFNVTVIDTLAPSVFCPIDVTISTNGDVIDPNSFAFIDEISTTPLGCDSVIVFFNNPSGNDNCGIPTITSSGIESGDTLEIGQYQVQFMATDDSGNVSNVLCETTITITSFVGLNVTALPDTVCTGESTQLFANLATPVPGAVCTWTGPNPNRVIPPGHDPILNNLTLDDAGTYILTVTNPMNSCTSIDSVEIVVLQGAELSFIANTANCIDPDSPPDIPLSVQVTNGVTVDSFIWTNPTGIVFSNNQNTMITNATEDSTGIYCVEVFAANGCSSTICDTIQITNIPVAPIIISSCEQFLCVGEPCTLTGVSVPVDSMVWTATGDDPGLPGDVNQSEIIITPGQNGFNLYTYTIWNNGCESSQSIGITVSSPASVDPDFYPVDLNTTLNFDVTDNDTIPGSLPGTFTINVTSDVNHGQLVNNGDGSFSYTPNNGFLGDDQFIYEICLDCDGQEVCRWAIVTLSIETEDCIIPSVITPNDDDFNDTWEISCVKNSPNNEVVIFNRWGDEVYRASPYNNDWEGTYNNEELPAGTYFYIFKTNANNSKTFKGTVNIYR